MSSPRCERSSNPSMRRQYAPTPRIHHPPSPPLHPRPHAHTHASTPTRTRPSAPTAPRPLASSPAPRPRLSRPPHAHVQAKEHGRSITRHNPKSAPTVLHKNGTSSGQRIAWGAPNKVGHFTKGSSPREFGNKMRHEQMRNEALGVPVPPNPPPPTR